MSAKARADLRGLFADLSETGAPAVPELPRGGAGTPGDGPRGPGSPIEFRLDAASGVPTYLQLVHQVEHADYLILLSRGRVQAAGEVDDGCTPVPVSGRCHRLKLG